MSQNPYVGQAPRWQKSNPIAYADWFRKRMDLIFNLKKAALAESLKATIEEVPDWRVKTPLQRSVQILKRHRDIYFQENPEFKPVSIIITTLAAHAYQNQDDVYDALIGIAKHMPSFIEKRNGIWWVQNPVDPDENFADKWNEYPERQEAFMKWLKKVENDFTTMSSSSTIDEGIRVLGNSLGTDTMTKVASKLGVKLASSLPAIIDTQPLVPVLSDASHALAPQWPINLNSQVKVSAGVYFMNKKGNKKGRFLWPLGDKSVSKNVWLRFVAKTNAREPYSIRWQVVNTGKEAIDDNQIRGDFYESEDSEKHVRWERTKYRGTHWVEAFVINHNGACVARSGQIFVKVR